MADTKTPKPRTSKPKPTPPGQGSMDFSKSAPWGKPGAGTPRASSGVSAAQSEKVGRSQLSQSQRSGATSRPTGTNTYSRTPIGKDGKPTLSGKPKYSSVSPEFNAVGARGFRDNPQTRAGMGGRPMVSSPVTKPGAALTVVNRQTPAVVPPQIPGTKPGPSGGSPKFDPTNNSTGRKFGANRGVFGPDLEVKNPGAALTRTQPGGPLTTIDDFADASKAAKGVKGLSRRGKGRLLGLGVLAAGLGTGYMLTRNRNENESAAKSTQKTTDMIVPGLNAPPSLGNAADRALYPAASASSGSSGASSSQASLSDRVRANNKANRSPKEYLGEAFDATVKRGRDVGRKHLQGMLVRDSVDEATARNLIARYDKEIGSQKTLTDYKSEGIAQKFDRENPGKAGRILDEYRAMGRSADAAPAGATYKDIKARALR